YVLPSLTCPCKRSPLLKIHVENSPVIALFVIRINQLNWESWFVVLLHNTTQDHACYTYTWMNEIKHQKASLGGIHLQLLCSYSNFPKLYFVKTSSCT
ncbi:hypothetical protein ANANG_G00063470, partial [Anguilla anguilla]